MSRTQCHANKCFMVIDCTLPEYCGNPQVVKPELREKVDAWLKGSNQRTKQ